MSVRFDDAYCNPDNGLEECHHVFLGPNRLIDRFQQTPTGGHFVIAETGFGTGLNFLAAWAAWDQNCHSDNACLHFVSFERYPLTPEQISRAMARWPDLARYTGALLDVYPPAVSGAHRLVLDGGRVRLTLWLGDAEDGLNSLRFTADTWFLDGFSPAKNSGMWTDKLISGVSARSRPGTTLSTYTASGEVRKKLADEGFIVEKLSGYGSKSEMISAYVPTSPSSDIATRTSSTDDNPRSIAIVGAGIAGTLLASNLARRGVGVTLIDRARAPGAGASGNSQGALYVKLGVEFNDQTQLALSALLFSQRYYRQLPEGGWNPTGLMQLAYNTNEADRQKRFLERNNYPPNILRPISSDEATQLSGIPVSHNGLWFPGSGWLEPQKICKTLARNCGITTHYGFEVDHLSASDNQWRLTSSEDQSVTVDAVVICAGHETPALIPSDGEFRLKPIRGQITAIPDHALISPDVVICGPGYLNPSLNGQSLVGATFDLHNFSGEVSQQSDRENLRMLDKFLPGVLKSKDTEHDGTSCHGRVGFRCTTHDYQPVAGPMKEANGKKTDGLFLLTGLGSKGLTYAPLLAEYIADILTNQPQSLPENLVRRVETQRIHRKPVTQT